jgi:hypothetical protein
MPDEIQESENDVKLPRAYEVLEQLAAKHFVGCVLCEMAINFWAKNLLKGEIINVLNLFIILYGLLCLVLAGDKSLDKITRILGIIKKIKFNG